MPASGEQLATLREFFIPQTIELTGKPAETAERVQRYIEWHLTRQAQAVWDYVLEEAAKACDAVIHSYHTDGHGEPDSGNQCRDRLRAMKGAP
jgi:hypothetical protein